MAQSENVLVTPKFKAILADPPWPFNAWDGPTVPTRAKVKRGMAVAQYPVMKMPDILALGEHVKQLSDDDSCLFLWGTWPRLKEAIETGEAWGFRYVTAAFVWTKLSPRSPTLDQLRETLLNTNNFWLPVRMAKLIPKIHFGLGYWTHSGSEFCLLFTKGSPKRKDMGVAQVILAPITRHSEKPPEIYNRVERLVEGPYLEIFGRKARPGWTQLGNDLEDGLDIRESLPNLIKRMGIQAEGTEAAKLAG